MVALNFGSEDPSELVGKLCFLALRLSICPCLILGYVMLLPKALGLIRDVMVDLFVYSEDLTCGRRVQMSASDIKFCISDTP